MVDEIITDAAPRDEVQTVPLTETTQTEAVVPLPTTKLSVVPNWKSVLKTYSFWFYASSIVLTLVDQILPLLSIVEPVMTGSTYVIVVFSLNLLGVLSRFIQQKKLWVYPTEEPKE